MNDYMKILSKLKDFLKSKKFKELEEENKELKRVNGELSMKIIYILENRNVVLSRNTYTIQNLWTAKNEGES